MLACDAEITTDNDTQGKLIDLVFTVDIPEQDHETFQDRNVQMVSDLGDTDTFVIGGLHRMT